MVLALTVTLLAGGLVACRAGEQTAAGVNGAVLVHGWMDADDRGLTYERVDWIERDAEAEDTWWEQYWAVGTQETLSAALAEGAELLYCLDGELYPLNPRTMDYSIRMAQDGRLMELTFDENGEVSRLVLRGAVSLDLTAADLDFTGYTGTVYTQGNQGAIFTEGSFTITEEPGTTAEIEDLNTMRLSLTENAALSVDPCDAQGSDSDHTQYLLPLSQDAEFSAGIAISLTGMLSHVDPGPYVLTLENGVVTAVRRAEDQFCAYIMLDGADDPLTLMTDYTMEDGTSFCCSVYYPDGGANYLSGSGTAYPIRYDGTGIYVAGGHFVGRYVFEKAAGELYLAEYANELFDENGAAAYIHYTRDGGEQRVEDNSALAEMFDRYSRGEAVRFEP